MATTSTEPDPQEGQQISLNDELLQQLRYRSGWAAYLATMALVVMLMTVSSILSILGTVDLRLVLLGLIGLLAFMLLAGIVAYQVMARKHR